MSKKRNAKDEKFGFGGRKRLKKQNDASSAADMEGFRPARFGVAHVHSSLLQAMLQLHLGQSLRCMIEDARRQPWVTDCWTSWFACR